MKLLVYDSEPVFTLEVQDGKVVIVHCIEAFRPNLRAKLHYGVSYPSGTPLHEFNFRRDEDPTTILHQIGGLYNKLFKLKTKILNVVDELAEIEL